MDKLHGRFKGIVSSSAVVILLGLYFLGASAPSVLADEKAMKCVPSQQVSPPLCPVPSQGLLMSVLDKAGMANPLSNAGINIYGYVEGGYFHDFTRPQKGGATFILFNSFKNSGVFDKVSLNVERTVDPCKKQFDLGFRLEGIYGSDAAFIHSNGMWAKETGHTQSDLLQAYVDATIPGIPARLRVGKWIELAGFEQYSANIYGAFGDPSRALYSYSYQFLFAEPGTQTGILATYVLNPQWTFDAGLTRGWNQSTRDSNGTSDFLGRLTFTPSDKTTVIFVMTEGPEFPIAVGNNVPTGDNKDWWTALDLVVTQKVNDKLKLGLGLDYVETPQIPNLKDGTKQWGGVAGYLSYALDPHFTLNTRLEWYQDAASGFSTGAPVGANYYESTVGVAIKPFPKDKIFSNLLFRPEIRYDRSNRPVFNSNERNQWTFSMDALFTF